MNIDLHTHSTASDGSLTPSQLTKYAYEKKLSAFSLTDHDTINGLYEASLNSKKFGIEFVPGLEISAKWADGELHILGYYIDPENEILLEGLSRYLNARNRRNPKMISKLNDLGFDISIGDIESKAGGNVIGRPHFARVMIDKGYVNNFEEAFEKYIGDGMPAYVSKDKMTIEDAVSIIQKSGGVAVIAHPIHLTKDKTKLPDIIKFLKDAGFDGIEAIHSDHSKEDITFFKNIAKELDLIITGGSDFHTCIDSKVDLGSVNVLYKYLEEMKNYLNKKKVTINYK